MTEAILEKSLYEFDYSVFSKVKESLLEELLQRHRRKNFKSLSQQLAEEMLSDEELDYVAAAGTPFLEESKNFSPKIASLTHR